MGEYGEEGRQRYLPVKLSLFSAIAVAIRIAGHFHSNFGDATKFRKINTLVFRVTGFGYRRETGIRKVNLFTIGEVPQPRLLNSFIITFCEFRWIRLRRNTTNDHRTNG